MDETFASLEAEYCPPLDPALLSAILYDYDLNDANSISNARQILDELKENAVLEEAAGFDASGTGAGTADESLENHSGSPPATSASLSRETGVTSLSNDLPSLGLDDENSDAEHWRAILDEPEGFADLDEHAKTVRLQGILGPQVSQYSIRHALRKCSGNWDAAVEDLLTQAFLAGEASAQNGGPVNGKGIEGFSEGNIILRGRKKKAKGRRSKAPDQRRSSSLPGLDSEGSSPATNKWASATTDIDFVATRTGIQSATISSIYYDNGASLSKTIATLLKASMEESKLVVADETAVAREAEKLRHEFPTISFDYRAALIRLTDPSMEAAQELAAALTAKPKDVKEGELRVVTRYVPPVGLEDGINWNSVTRKARSATSSRSHSTDDPLASARRDTYSAARAAAFAQASAAHRKAKSDRLMGGAAAYYSQVGREYAALSSQASAEAADQLAASQSSATELDLHGIDVLNAVRIAREHVEAWWDGLGESRVNGRVGADKRQEGYRIVVGLGRHSEGGKGKLGPAVTKGLREDGWRVEAAGAIIVVKGLLK